MMSPAATMARWCAAVFRLGQNGFVGNVITRANTTAREDETKAREAGAVRSCAGHDDPQLRRGRP